MTQTFDPIQITPSFYQLGIPFFPAYLSMGKEGMLIEAGLSGTADIIIQQIESLDIDPEQIKYIALTHSHSDHIGALPRLKKRWPHLKCIATPTAKKILSDERTIKQFKGMDMLISEILKSKSIINDIPEALDEYDFSVDIEIEEDSRFDLGDGISWSTSPIPGHTNCQTAFFEDKEKTLAIGDAIGFYVPKVDAFWPNYFESMGDYTNSLERLARFPAERIALGHNGIIEQDIKKFFARAIQATYDYHNEMLDRLENKEALEDIAQEKADMIWAISDRMMPHKVIIMLCQLLIKKSSKIGKLS